MTWGNISPDESISGGWAHTPEGMTDDIISTIGVKQGYPLSSTLFGIYIDEILYFIDRFGSAGGGP